MFFKSICKVNWCSDFGEFVPPSWLERQGQQGMASVGIRAGYSGNLGENLVLEVYRKWTLHGILKSPSVYSFAHDCLAVHLA